MGYTVYSSVYSACEDTKLLGTVCEMNNRSITKTNLGKTDRRFQLWEYIILAYVLHFNFFETISNNPFPFYFVFQKERVKRAGHDI